MSQTKAQLLDPLGDFTLTGQLIGVGATFSGNVSVGGTLTKQDVTNVDSVGIITARTGIKVIAGGIEAAGAIDFDQTLNVDGQTTFRDRVQIINTYPEILFTKTGGGLDSRIHNDGSGNLIFGTGTDSDTPTDRLRIDSNGRVLVGTTTEGHTSADDLTIETLGHTGITLRSGTSSAGSIYFSSATSGGNEYNGYIIYDQGDDSLRFGTNENNRLRIVSDGKVGIGTDNPIKKFDVRGTGNQGILIGSYDNTGAQLIIDGNGNGDAGGGNYGALEHKSNGDFTIRNHDASQSIIFGAGSASGANDSLVINSSQNATFAGTVSDSKGNLRSIPQNYQASNYTLVSSDAGKHILADGNITWTDNTFAAGDAVTILNATGGDITITKGNTMFFSGDGSNANRTMSTKGVATILWTSGTAAYISGAGLS